MIVTDPRVSDFVSDVIGVQFFPPYTAMGMEIDGEIKAGLVFNCYQRNDIHVSAAGNGWGKNFLREVGAYVYDKLKCRRMTFVTEYEDVAQLGEKIGGKREGVLRDHFGEGRDGIVIGVLRNEYKYGRLA